MTISIRNGGAWRNATSFSLRAGGAWRSSFVWYRNISGVWTRFSIGSPVLFSTATDGDTFGSRSGFNNNPFTTLDGYSAQVGFIFVNAANPTGSSPATAIEMTRDVPEGYWRNVTWATRGSVDRVGNTVRFDPYSSGVGNQFFSSAVSVTRWWIAGNPLNIGGPYGSTQILTMQ